MSDRSAEEALRQSIAANGAPSKTKPVVPKTTIGPAYHTKCARTDADFVPHVIGNCDRDLERKRLDMARSEASDALRRMSGRAVPPAQDVDPRRTQLTGLAKACGCKAVDTVVGLVPDHIKTDIQIVEWLDSFAQAVPHCFDTDLTDRTVSQVIQAATSSHRLP